MTQIDVTPRSAGDPRPDTLGMRLAHRTMLRDAARLPALLQQLAAAPVIPARAEAVAEYVEDFCDSVHHHHSAEDAVLWPVLAASAGAHVDLAELSDDHAALDPLLDRVRAGAARFRRTPDEDAATALAVDLGDLRDVLAEHIADEEASVLPAIEEHVSVADWREVESEIRTRAKLTFEVPRVLAVVTPKERAVLMAEGGLVLRLMIAVLVPPFRRRERDVFGD